MKLNFRVIGAGPPLLILHGLLGTLDNWQPQARSLAEHFQVFTLDLRNHGNSPHAPEFNYDLLAADLAEFFLDQAITRAHLIGHSMGGKAAMRFAQLHPGAVDRLVVVDMAPREYPPRYAGILAAMLALKLSDYQRREEVEVALTSTVPDRALRQFLLKNLGRSSAGGLIWKPNVEALSANYLHIRAALPRTELFSGPTLFVRGERSDYIRGEDEAAIRESFTDARFATILNAGHWVQAEAPAAFLGIVREFLLAAS